MNSFFNLNIDKIDKIIQCLDELFLGLNIITGYNGYFKVPQENNISFCFSNMYAGKKYSKDRLCDLKELNYSKKDINNCIREKIGVYEWESDWSIRKDGKLQSKLKIRKFGTDDYINLKKLNKEINSLSDIFEDDIKFIAEDKSSEINISVDNIKSLTYLVDLFMKKASIFLFNDKGENIGINKYNWREAWNIPVLLIGGNILNYESYFPQFTKASKFLKRENGNELSFIIHNKIKELKESSYLDKLINFGFEQEFCLANKSFILKYVDIPI